MARGFTFIHCARSPGRYDVTHGSQTQTILVQCRHLLAAAARMPMDAFLDILYTSAPIAPHPLKTFDFFVPLHNNNLERAPLICFVHGGAWRS